MTAFPPGSTWRLSLIHIYPDGVAEAVHASVPDVLNQLFLTDRASLMQQQIFQYAALLPRQSKGLTVHSSNAATGVEAQPSAAQTDVLLNKFAPGQAAHPGFQLCKVKGLGKVIVRPGIQPLHFICDFTACRQDQHTGLKVVPAQSAQHLHSVHLGQVEVQQYKVVPVSYTHLDVYKRQIVNRSEHIIVEPLASGKHTEVNPMGFTIVLEENGHNPNHSYYDIK